MGLLSFIQKINPFNKTEETAVEKSTYFPPSYEAPYNPDVLYKKVSGYDLFDECLRDDVVNSIIEYKMSLILGAGFYVESDDDEVRDFWDVALNDTYEGSFQQVMRKMLSCVSYGFSLTEKVYKSINVNGKERWGLKFLKSRPPHGIKLETDDYGNLKNVIQEGIQGSQAKKLNPNDFILFTYRPRFENPYGQADLTSGIYRSVIAKKSIIKFMLIAAERYAQPMAVGTHPALAKSTDVDTFYNILKNLSAKAVMTKSEEYSVELLEAQNKDVGAAYINILNFLNLSIARGLLISDLLGMSGAQMASGGLGGGLGDVQFKVMMEIFKRTREELIALINRHLIFPLTKFNFGEEAYAELKITELSDDEKYKSVEMLLKFLEKGQSINEEQRNWFFEAIGVPIGESQPEDEINNPDVQLPVEDMPEDIPPEFRFSWDDKKVEKYRELSLSEKRVDFAEISNKTIELAGQYTNRVDKSIKNILRTFYDFLRNRKIVENKRFPLLKQLKLTGIGELKNVFSDMLDESLKYGIDVSNRELGKTLSATSSDLGIEIAARPIVNEWKKSRVLWLTKNVTDDVIKKAEILLSDAMLKGLGTKEAIKQLDDSLEETLSKAKLEMITRTNVMSAFNQGRLQSAKKVPGVIGMQWSAVLDARTSDICNSLDGKIFRPNEVNDYPMPAHPNCRSLWVSVFEEDTEGQTEKEIYESKPNVEKKNGFLKIVKEA